jgi:1-acyl-sn-glycerol-3-phosphate acyltransferase
MTKFHDGAFKLAVDTGKQIMPALIFNTAKVLPAQKSFFFWPQKVEMHFLSPVSIENKSVTELKNEVFRLMETYYISHQ